MIMEKTIYYSPKVKEINLSIKRSVCENVSPVEAAFEYGVNENIDGNDDFSS